MRTALLQDWITVHADADPAIGGVGVSEVTQNQGDWRDVSSFAAATFLIDVTEVVAPTGVNVVLTLQTSPTLDESYFLPVAPPLNPLLASPGAQATQTVRAPGMAPLARYLRWQLSTSGPTTAGTWGATFRIRAATSLESFFVPTDLGNCVLWLRADMGITFLRGGVSTWADQSGNGHNASYQGAVPGYQTDAMNGAPALVGNGTSTWMQTAAFTIGTSATILAAVQPSLSPQDGYARLVEQEYDMTYLLSTDSTGTEYKLIVNDGTPPFGAAQGGVVTVGANTIVSGLYSSSGGTGSVYVNGVLVGSDTFTAPTSGVSLPVSIMQAYNGMGAHYWGGLFAEAIIYSRALSATELTRVHRYLTGRYGVAM